MTTMDLLDEPFWGAGGLGFSLAELRAGSDAGRAQRPVSAPAKAGGGAGSDGDTALLWGCGGLGLPRPR